MDTDTPTGLARRLETCDAWRGVRYAEAYRRLHPQARSETLAAGGGYAVFVAPDSPLNSARALGTAGPVRAEDLEAVEDFFASRGAQTAIHACPLADESLFTLLRERGYRLDYFFSVLARAIPPGFQPEPPPGGIEVSIAGPDEAELWLDVTARGFEETDHPSPEAYDILGPNFYAGDALAFFAWVTDEAVPGQPPARQAAGGGGMYLAPEAGAFELGGASTRLAFRRRGVQRALIEARLAEGVRRGCDLAMVLTSPGSDSERNLRRAGFSLAYTKVVMVK